MKIPAVKGTRDLYPEDFAPIRRIFDVWRDVSIRHGFQEFEGPTLEYLDLYREKSGEELVGQLYRLTDSGGRELALRPELTPTLARMVAARINALPRPIKWFSIPTLFRGENVQRGRLREFFQWNVDVVGTADVAADAEVILVGVEALRELGLTASDVRVHISNRKLMAALLGATGIPEEQHDAAYALLDKAGRMASAAFAEKWNAAFGEQLKADALTALLDQSSVEDIAAAARSAGASGEALGGALKETHELITILQNFGILEFCRIDLRVVRGLAYYTGPVFEFYDLGAKERAICGGGRYDDLLGKLGTSKEPAVGFGMGDVVLSLILRERGLLGGAPPRQGVFVVAATDRFEVRVREMVAALRRKDVRAEFNYGLQAIGKQLKNADKRRFRFAVVVGEAFSAGGVVQLKDLETGQARDVQAESLIEDPSALLVAK